MPSRRFPKTLDGRTDAHAVTGFSMRMASSWRMSMASLTAPLPSRLTNDEGRRISKLISRLPELVELEMDRNKARSRRKPQPLRFKPMTAGDLIKSGKLLEVHCSSCRPERHLYLDAGSLGLPRRVPVPEVADHLVCSVCGAKNSESSHPIG